MKRFAILAAGLLAVQEAGGVVTDWWGRGPTVYERTGVLLVANRATHAFLLEQLKDVPAKDPVGAVEGRTTPSAVSRFARMWPWDGSPSSSGVTTSL